MTVCRQDHDLRGAGLVLDSVAGPVRLGCCPTESWSGDVGVTLHVCVCVCVPGVLDSGEAEFEDDEEVYDAIGGVLQEMSAEGKNEEDIRNICLQMFNTLKL